jgi:hypothetical protein
VLSGGIFTFKMKELSKSIQILSVFLSFFQKLTAQLPPLTAAIDFSCKTAFRNIFSGELFDLSAPAAFYWNRNKPTHTQVRETMKYYRKRAKPALIAVLTFLVLVGLDSASTFSISFFSINFKLYYSPTNTKSVKRGRMF